VVRNRIRRRLRAIIREIGVERPEQIPPGAYLVGAGADAAALPYDELRTMVSEALRAVTAHRRPAECRP
jgi:ribonuclease P protein component